MSLKLSVPHEGCKFLSCKIKFRTGEGRTHETNTKGDKTGQNVADEVLKALIYAHGYEKAMELVNDIADMYKHNWQE